MAERHTVPVVVARGGFLTLVLRTGFSTAVRAQDDKPSLEIYGFAQADAIADFKQNNPDWYDANRPTKLVRANPGNPITPIVGEALPIQGIVAFLDHNWSDRWSTAAGYNRENNSDGFSVDDYRLQFSLKYNFSYKTGS